MAREDTEVTEQFLLANPEPECLDRKFRLRRTRRRRFDGREFARARLNGHNGDHLTCSARSGGHVALSCRAITDAAVSALCSAYHRVFAHARLAIRVCGSSSISR
jgi:hypothetical protein